MPGTSGTSSSPIGHQPMVSTEYRRAGRRDQSFDIMAVISVLLASSTSSMAVAATNAGLWSFSIGVLVVPGVGVLFGLGLLILVRRWNGMSEAGGIAAVVGVLLLTAGGEALVPAGLWAPLVVVGIAGFTYGVVNRLQQAFRLNWVRQWLAITLALINAVLAVQIITGEHSHREDTPIVQSSGSGGPDVVLIILDEFASLDTAPLRPEVESRLAKLAGAGYHVYPTLWAPYTISAAAIPALLDGSYPLRAGDIVDERSLRNLGEMSRGNNRLVNTLKSRGYRVTQIESGLWLSSCGPNVDVCVPPHPLNEMAGVLLEQSAFASWYERLWGHSFVQSGLHSMTATRRVMLEIGQNDQSDLVVAHIMLPHIPYLLGVDCGRHDLVPGALRTVADRFTAYERQAGCAGNWLAETLEEFDGGAPERATVAVLGDHGTNLSGQLSKPLEEWTDRESVERLAAFGVVRFPAGCDADLSATAQVVDTILSCLAGEPPSLEPRHFLASYGGSNVHVIEYPPARLDASLALQRSEVG